MKYIESHDGKELEIRRSVVGVVTNLFVDTPEMVGKLLLTDGLPVDPNPLVGGHEMRRGEESGFESLTEQDGLREGTGGPLALRPGHVYDPELIQLFQGHPGFVEVPKRGGKC